MTSQAGRVARSPSPKRPEPRRRHVKLATRGLLALRKGRHLRRGPRPRSPGEREGERRRRPLQLRLLGQGHRLSSAARRLLDQGQAHRPLG